MLAASSCFTFQAELCAVPYLVIKKTVTQFAELRFFFRQSAMYVIFRLLRPVTCLPAFVSLFYISLQSSSEFFYHPSCGCNFKLLLKCYFFVSQDDLRRANRDLNKGKDEMKNLTSKIGKCYINIYNLLTARHIYAIIR